ncbi:MAG: hypothetical protein NVS9B9_25340 [Ktedonobacteraceae bacterium]
MFFVIIVIALFIVLDIVALRWGADTRERMSSLEWERRAHQEELFVRHQA